MSNLTDALIAAKLVGGSGGSGGGSGLPEITTTPTTILAEQSVAFTEFDGRYGSDALNIELLGRASYTVTWDGTDYTCIAVDLGVDGVAVGNLSIWELGDDTGEPFVISYYSGDATYAGTLSTAATHTLKIVGQIQSPAEGSALVVVNGEWKAQGGYGYENGGAYVTFDEALLPMPRIAKVVVQNSEAITVPPSAKKQISFSFTIPSSQPVPIDFLTWEIFSGGTNYAGSFAVLSSKITRHGAEFNIKNITDSSVTIPADSSFHIICANSYQIELA